MTLLEDLQQNLYQKKCFTTLFFFENNRGLHFRSLQSLYAQGVTGKYHSGTS